MTWSVCPLTASGVTPTPTTTHTYSYSDGAWGDLLTSYDGHSYNYDEIGNPTSYYNKGKTYTFDWTGRRLTAASTTGKTMSFTYNDNGLRTSKTVNGVTTRYIYDGTKLLAEFNIGDSTKPISFYAELDGENPLESSVGIKININNFSFRYNIGVDDLSYNASLKDGDTTNSIAYKADFTKFKIGLETSTTQNIGNISSRQYTNCSINGWTIVAAAITAYAGQVVTQRIFAH